MQFLRDLRYSVRLLRKTPAFSAITLLIIVLGLSLYTTAYTVEQILTDKPLPYPEGDRYVALKTFFEATGNDRGLSNHDPYSYRYIEENSEVFASIDAYRQTAYVLSDGDYASTFRGAAVEWEILENAGVVPILGRVFDETDSVPGAPSVILIGESIWESYYNNDPDIIGHTSQINGEPATIVGVLPESFQFPVFEEVWMPLSIPTYPPSPGNASFDIASSISLVGILKPDASLDQASTELNTLTEKLATSFPNSYRGRQEYITPFVSLNQPRNFNFGPIMSFLTLVILTLAVINLASLLFIRSRSRQHELAVRSSIGASGQELAKQVLLESFVICFVGWIVALLLSFALIHLLNVLFVNSMGALPFWFEMALDTAAVLNAAFFATAVWLVSGLPIAMRAFRSQTATILNSGTKGGQKHGRSVVTKVVVASELVLSFFLLVCCGVILYVAERITSADYGIDTTAHMIAAFSLDDPNYESGVSKNIYIQSLIDRSLEITDVETAVVSNAPPGKAGSARKYQLEDRDIATNSELPRLDSIWVSNDYFSSLGINLIAGREFTGADTAGSMSVGIITQEMAQQVWPADSAIGKRIGVTFQDNVEWLTVVGIIPNLLQSSFNLSDTPPNIYRPIRQNTPDRFYLLVQFQASATLASLERELRLAAAEIDRNIAVDNFRVLEREIHLNQAGLDIVKQIFITFSLATFILAGIGIYGVIARSIAMQTNEIGVRRAMGSTDYQIVARFLKQAMLFLTVGALIGGVAATIASSSALASLTSAYSLSEFLPGILLAVVFLMGLLVFTASYLPARKSIELEPGDALRYE